MILSVQTHCLYCHFFSFYSCHRSSLASAACKLARAYQWP